jgi:hypothetical protein
MPRGTWSWYMVRSWIGRFIANACGLESPLLLKEGQARSAGVVLKKPRSAPAKERFASLPSFKRRGVVSCPILLSPVFGQICVRSDLGKRRHEQNYCQ